MDAHSSFISLTKEEGGQFDESFPRIRKIGSQKKVASGSSKKLFVRVDKTAQLRGKEDGKKGRKEEISQCEIPSELSPAHRLLIRLKEIRRRREKDWNLSPTSAYATMSEGE